MDIEGTMKALKSNLEQLNKLQSDLEKLQNGEKVEFLTIEGAESSIDGLKKVIDVQQNFLDNNRKAYLEFTHRDEMSEDGGCNRIVDYELVIPLRTFDCRNNTEEGFPNDIPGWKRVLLSQTRTSGPSPIRDGKVRTPFRDGAHSLWDSEAMNGLEIWARYGEVRTLVKASDETKLRS